MQNEFNWSLYEDNSKYNTSIKLTESDKKGGVKILCKEPYAQELYDMMMVGELGSHTSIKKDLEQGDVCKVQAMSISYTDKKIYVEDTTSKVGLSVPIKEYSKTLDSLANGLENREFFVKIYRVTSNGEYLASEKQALSVSHKQELFEHLEKNTWFDVKLVKLIKGGYQALYNEVECFVPGSHAAANVVRNFNELLGKTITVMVDNYDPMNDLFILSYKKYVTHSMPSMVTELKFDQEYDGILTNSPSDFGVFVELNGYYTGLIHKTEFENFDEIRRTMRTGDHIPVFVKDVVYTKGQYRIVLTISQDKVNNEKMRWQDLRNRTENNSFSYTLNAKNSSIAIDIDGQDFEVSLKKKDLDRNFSELPFVKVFKVDPINCSIKFEFVEAAL